MTDITDAEVEAAAQQIHYELGITITHARITAARALTAARKVQPQIPDGWHPMATEPRDGSFRLYGLTVVRTHKTGHEWFEVHYLAIDDDGNFIEPSGDIFTDWSPEDCDVWAAAPAQPLLCRLSLSW